MHAFTLGPEQDEQFGGFWSGAAEPLRGEGVELGGLAGLHDEVEFGQPQPHTAGYMPPRRRASTLVPLRDYSLATGKRASSPLRTAMRVWCRYVNDVQIGSICASRHQAVTSVDKDLSCGKG